MKPFNLENLKTRYLAGETFQSLAMELGVSACTIKVWLVKAGITPRTKKEALSVPRTEVDSGEICRRYLAGEPGYTIATSLGVSRQVVNKRLVEAGILIRNWKESLLIQGISHPTERMSQADRQQLTAAAHNATRGKKQTLEHRCKVSASNEANPKSSPLEIQMKSLLRSRIGTLVIVPQKSVGPYNIDLALTMDSIAVELFGGHWHAHGKHASGYRKRLEYLLDAGWTPVIVWVSHSYSLTVGAADYIVALRKMLRTQEAPRRQEHVIWGTGEVIPADQRDPNTGARKVRFHGTYRPRGNDGRFRK